jgi:hypothetical protein
VWVHLDSAFFVLKLFVQEFVLFNQLEQLEFSYQVLVLRLNSSRIIVKKCLLLKARLVLGDRTVAVIEQVRLQVFFQCDT